MKNYFHLDASIHRNGQHPWELARNLAIAAQQRGYCANVLVSSEFPEWLLKREATDTLRILPFFAGNPATTFSLSDSGH